MNIWDAVTNAVLYDGARSVSDWMVELVLSMDLHFGGYHMRDIGRGNNNIKYKTKKLIGDPLGYKLTVVRPVPGSSKDVMSASPQ